MTLCKNIFLSIFLLLYSNSLMAYGATGHARQQLRLVAAELIETSLDGRVMGLSLPQLPLTILDNQSAILRQKLDVLVAEGLLLAERIVVEQRALTANGWVQRNTAGVRYYQASEPANDPIYYGEAELVRVGELVTDVQPDGFTEVRVYFSWRASELAEWVWAPAFNEDPRLDRIKASHENPIRGVAYLEWRGDHWGLTALQAFDPSPLL